MLEEASSHHTDTAHPRSLLAACSAARAGGPSAGASAEPAPLLLPPGTCSGRPPRVLGGGWWDTAALQIPIPLQPLLQVTLAPFRGVLFPGMPPPPALKSTQKICRVTKFWGHGAFLQSKTSQCRPRTSPYLRVAPFSWVLQRERCASNSQTPNWQSPSLVIWTQPLASCVTLGKSPFLSLSFHLCEMGLKTVPS